MPFYAEAAAVSARYNRLTVFRKLLKSSACIALILVATGAAALADGKYFNADGSKTDDLEAAATTWRTDLEFIASTGLGDAKAEYAYAMGFTGKNVSVGIYDTGVYGKHPEFAGDGKLTGLHTEGNYAYTYNDYYKAGDAFSFNGNDPLHGVGLVSPDRHGTHVGGIVAANRNGSGMHGVAFDAKLIAAHNSDAGPEDGVVAGNDANAYTAGFNALIGSGARIINNSWGIGFLGNMGTATGPKATKVDVITQFNSAPNDGTMGAAASVARAGILYVKSAGNKYGSEPDALGALPYFHPDIESHWVTVANLSAFSSAAQLSASSSICGMAKYYCLSAPGTSIYSAVYEQSSGSDSPGYDKLTGTSMAAPMVAGALAVLIERYPYLNNKQVRDVLLTTAEHIGSSAKGTPDTAFGWGQLDLKAAMNGSAQFMDRFVVNLSKDDIISDEVIGKDTWSNDISDKALIARKVEELKEVADWQEKKKANGWENGYSAADAQIEVDILVPQVRSLLTSLEAAIRKQKFASALDAVKSNPLATTVWSRMVARSTYGQYLEGYGAQPTYKFVADSVATDLANFLKAADIVVAADILVTKEILLAGYNGAELRTNYLTAKLADPSSYESGLTKLGTGQLTLTGDSTYSGDTIVDGGELVIGKEGSITSASFVNDTALFTVEGIAAATTVNKGGRLNVAVGGSTGDTSVIGGWAAVNGNSGATSVGDAGVVSGSGTLDSLIAKSGGVVSPGNSVGTLNVSKDTTFEKGSSFEVEIKADQSLADQLAVAGTANLLGGAVNVRLEGKTALLSDGEIKSFFSKRYDIVTAGTKVEGTFDTVNPAGNFNYVWTELDYSDTNKVVLGFDRKDVAWTVGVNTHNQRAVSGAVESLEQGNALYNSVLFSSSDNPLDFDTLSGEVHATLSGVLAADSHFIADAATSRVRNAFGGVAGKEQAVTTPLAYGPESKAKHSEAFAAVEPAPATTAFWGEAYGSWAHADGDGNASGYSRNTGGLVTGFDGIVADDWRFGLLAGYGSTSLQTGYGKASVDSYQVGVYGGTKIDALGLRLGVNLGQHEIDTKRTARFGSLNNEHEASYDAQTVQVFGELGYEIVTPYATLEPFAAARHVHVKTNSFNEDGAVSNLSGEGSSTDLTITTLGLRAAHQFTLNESTTLTARGMLGWTHGFGDVTPEASLALNGGAGFTVEGAGIAKDAAIIEAGFDIGIGRATTIGLSYTGQFSSQSHDNAIKADLNVRF
ncbi:autotransporter domain-containing protein [Phyllobacterium sp. SB3]|uniref:autotransporter domain-containing protein n=1 Tax=Phyllobacterium sp. SB3 TaxID=3156073 RepID=UPI0032AF9EF5